MLDSGNFGTRDSIGEDIDQRMENAYKAAGPVFETRMYTC